MSQTNGANRLPSVTEVLRAAGLTRDFKGVPAHLLEHAQLRGQALHQAIQWHHEGTLDQATLHPEIEPGFRAYQRFLVEMHHKPIASEIELVHPTWNFIGHLDRVGWLGPSRVIIDFKYTETPDLVGAAYQIAAYRMLWAACRPQEPISAGYVLQLTLAGRYQPHLLEEAQAEQVFLAALVVFRARQRRDGHEH